MDSYGMDVRPHSFAADLPFFTAFAPGKQNRPSLPGVLSFGFEPSDGLVDRVEWTGLRLQSRDENVT